MAFLRSFGNSSELLAAWQAQGPDPCTGGWRGISCDSAGGVTSIALPSQGLRGAPRALARHGQPRAALLRSLPAAQQQLPQQTTGVQVHPPAGPLCPASPPWTSARTSCPPCRPTCGRRCQRWNASTCPAASYPAPSQQARGRKNAAMTGVHIDMPHAGGTGWLGALQHARSLRHPNRSTS